MTYRSDGKHTHESQPAENKAYNEQVTVSEELLPIQRIEGGGPPRPVKYERLPRPLRIFGYAVTIFMIACALAVIGISVFK